ncbi:two-component regulator propeller domain-containing protein [Pedobacter sp. MW01-1-1]|uniref:two-component regulator propeller domain-containing protein n=1 Tax=Pedobacter sp. MW01-1-1 TaxID=3383027 RepID=UPI003FF0B5C7
MTKLLKSLLFFIIFLSIEATFAQNLKFKQISLEEGLSNSTIECIFQDHRGFLWFGTRDGLNKYDGNQITVFKTNGSENSLSDNFIRCIFEDKQHILWIGTADGLNKFNAQKNNFSIYRSGDKDGKNAVTSIIETEQGLLIGTYGGGLKFLDETKKNFSRFEYQSNTQKQDFIYDLYRNNDGMLWIAGNAGIQTLNLKSKQAQALPELERFTIRQIKKSNTGEFWFATEESGLINLQPTSHTIQIFNHQETNKASIGSDLVRAIAFDQHKNLWIGGINGGLDRFDPATKQFKHYQNEPGNSTSLSQRTVSSLFVDKQGNLWIGTHRGGVNLYSPQAEKFKLFRQEQNKNSLSYNDVRAFCEDRNNGNIYIGTDGGGLDTYNKTTKTFTHHRYNPFNPNSIGADAVLDITQTRNGQIYVGTWAGGLNILHADGTFTRYKHNADPHAISSDYVQKTFEDSEKNLWIGTYYGGLNLFNPQTKKFKRILTGANGSKLNGNNIVSIAEDHEKNLWIGTDDGGLNCYNLRTKTFSHYFTGMGKMPDLRVIFVDSKGNLWIGQSGLYLFNKAKKSFSLYTKKAALNTEFIKGITEDGNGIFWISTSKGLTKFNPKTGAFKKYNTGDGIQGLEFEANAYLKTKSGELFFGGVNGFNSFYPNDIQINKFVPPVYITEFQIFNRKIQPSEDSALENDISYTSKIKIDYDQATISFRFAALNYVSNENNNYAYKLDGQDKDWIHIGNANQAIYTNLDPGTYTFHVKASNNDNVWNENGQSVKIIISPPFWATWWFRIVSFAILCYAIYEALSFKRRLEIRKLEEEKREEIHQTQLQFFTNISHEFRTPLSLILGPIERLLKEDRQESFQNYYLTIHRNANRLLRLINELMDFRKTASGALKLNVINGNLNLFIDEVAEEFSEMAAEKNIALTVEKEHISGQIWFDRQVIEKIILNLVNNSLKYTKDGGILKIQVFTSLENHQPEFENQLNITSDYQAESYVYFRIIDSGIGISKESIPHLFERYYRITETHLGSGVGLAFVKSLTLLHKGIIRVSSERNKGTEIIIGIPAKKEDYTVNERFIQSSEAGGIRLESLSYGTETDAIQLESIPENEQSDYRILIVDDNDELRVFLRKTLSSSYKILEAIDGQSGLEIAKTEVPDLIISDVMMPGMTGTEFCKIVKNDLETSHIPFLMLTAKSSLEAEIEGAESGADWYFTKPINTDLLQITLKNIFEQREKLKDHYLKNRTSEPKELVHSEKDKDFMNKILSIIDEQMINPDMDIDYLCKEIGMSRTKLYQKLKSITGQSIGEFVRSARLRKAIEIMKTEDVLMTEVIYRIGIQTQSYFTKAFKKEFGVTPTGYMQRLKDGE